MSSWTTVRETLDPSAVRISRRSWHYRLIRWLLIEPPDNLCGYFWTVVLKVPLILAALVVLSPFIGAALAGLWLKEQWDERRTYRGPRPPGLVSAWLRAKKQRLCPPLEWVP